MNSVFLIGNLGADPEVKYLPSGTQVTNFSLAVTDVWKDRQTGEKREKTNWISIEAFGRTAEICSKYLKKGSKIAIRGTLSYQEWNDQSTGEKRSILRVKAMEMEMLQTPRTRETTSPNQFSTPDQRSSAPPPQPDSAYNEPDSSDSGSDLNDEIPF